MKLIVRDPLTFAGRDYRPGDVLEVRDEDALGLVAGGLAERVDEHLPSATPPA